MLRCFAGGESCYLDEAQEAFQGFTLLVSTILEAVDQTPIVVPVWPTTLGAIRCSPADDIITGMVIKTVDAFQRSVVIHGLQTLLQLSGWGSHITRMAQMHMHDMAIDMYMLKRAVCMTRDANKPVPAQYVCYNMEVLQKHASMQGGSCKTYFHTTLLHIGGAINDNAPLSSVPHIFRSYKIWVFPYLNKNGVYALLVVDTERKLLINFVPRVSSLDELKEAQRVTSKFAEYVSHTFPVVHRVKYVVAFFNNIPRSTYCTQFMCEHNSNLLKLQCTHSSTTIGHYSHVWIIAVAELYHEGIELSCISKYIHHAKYEVHMLYRCIVHAVTSPNRYISTPPSLLLTTEWRPSTFTRM
jgi:hypothetical protein